MSGFLRPDCGCPSSGFPDLGSNAPLHPSAEEKPRCDFLNFLNHFLCFSNHFFRFQTTFFNFFKPPFSQISLPGAHDCRPKLHARQAKASNPLAPCERKASVWPHRRWQVVVADHFHLGAHNRSMNNNHTHGLFLIPDSCSLPGSPASGRCSLGWLTPDLCFPCFFSPEIK
jgi:hypothetical protein